MPTVFAPIEHTIRTEAEYDAAVAEIDELLNRAHPKGSAKAERLNLLAVLVEAYETDHGYTIGDPTPQEAVLAALDQHGRDRPWLAELMGGNSRVSDFLNGRRSLSIGQMTKLHDELRIPIDLLFARHHSSKVGLRRTGTSNKPRPRRRRAVARAV